MSRPMEKMPYLYYSLKITILQRFELCIIKVPYGVMAEITSMPGQIGQNCEGDDEPGHIIDDNTHS